MTKTMIHSHESLSTLVQALTTNGVTFVVIVREATDRLHYTSLLDEHSNKEHEGLVHSISGYKVRLKTSFLPNTERSNIWVRKRITIECVQQTLRKTISILHHKVPFLNLSLIALLLNQ